MSDTPKQVCLRPIRASDLPHFFNQQRDSDACYQAAFTHADPGNRSRFDAHWEKILNRSDTLVRTIVWGAEVAGYVAAYSNEEGREVTYWLGREFWGRGIATHALGQFIELETTRPLLGRVAADHVASIRVLQKCGFVQIGTGRGFANARNREVDEVIMRLAETIIRAPRDEWSAAY